MPDGTGNAAPVDVESFFTGEDETQHTTEQQPQPQANEAPATEPQTPVWDGTKWTIKAAGKSWTPKDEEEAKKWMSFGINYQEKAHALNQEKAKLLAMRKEIEAAKEANQAGPDSTKEEDTSYLFSDPTTKYEQRVAALEKRLAEADERTVTQESQSMDVSLANGLESLSQEVQMTPEETDEILIELQGRVDTLPETAIDNPDKIKRLIRNLYFELHPDAIDEIVEKRATAKAEQVKKSIGAKIVTEGSAPSAPTGKPAPTDFLDAQNKLLDAWDALPK